MKKQDKIIAIGLSLWCLIGTFIILSFPSCKTPQNSVDGFQYDGNKVCVKGNVIIYAVTVPQLDSIIQSITHNIISFEHVSDSADAHVYKYVICSPPLKQK